MSEKKSKANFTFLLLDSSTFFAEPFKREREKCRSTSSSCADNKNEEKIEGFPLEFNLVRALTHWIQTDTRQLEGTRRQRTKLHCMEVVGHRPFLRATQKGLKTRVLCVCVCVYICVLER